jgi:hypothetical protein
MDVETHIEGVWKQDAEENFWTEEVGQEVGETCKRSVIVVFTK